MNAAQQAQQVRGIFADSVSAMQAAQAALPEQVARGALEMTRALDAGNKIMACGNGGSAADAVHFAAELVNRFERERRPLAALALNTDTSTLTSIANDYHYDEVFARQLRALGRAGDVLLVITSSGNSPNLSRAVEAATAAGIRCVALSGRDGGALAPLLSAGEHCEIRAPGDSTARIQEIHAVAIHCFCSLIDQHLLDED